MRSLFRPADLGGNRYPWEVTLRLAGRGHRVRVITPKPNGPLPGPSDIEMVTYPVSRATPLRTFMTNAIGSRLVVGREIRADRPDAILVSSYEVAYAAAVRRSQIPLLFIYHSHFRSDAVRDLASRRGIHRLAGRTATWFVSHVERRVLAAADRIVAVSPFSVREILERLPGAQERVRLITTGVDTATFVPGDRSVARSALGIPADARVLLFVGRLATVKRIDRVIEALRILRRQDSRYLLSVVGRGPEEPALRTLAQRVGVEDAIRFEGYQEGAALRKLFAAADVQICTSEFENWSLALLEGLSCGLPIVGVPAGGIPELVGEVDARCVAPGHEAPDVAVAVSRLFEEPGALEEIGRRARQIAVDRYDWDRIVSLLENVIGEVVP